MSEQAQAKTVGDCENFAPACEFGALTNELTQIGSEQIEQMSNMQNDSDSDLSVLSVETVSTQRYSESEFYIKVKTGLQNQSISPQTTQGHNDQK